MTKGGDNNLFFRYVRSAESKWLQGYHKDPQLNVPKPPLVPEWQDLDEAAALQAAHERGLLVQGSSEVGKATWGASWLRAYVRRAKLSVVLPGFTWWNFQIGAVTADHWCVPYIRNRDCRGVDHMVCDEVSKMNVQIGAQLCVAKKTRLQIRLFANATATVTATGPATATSTTKPMLLLCRL